MNQAIKWLRISFWAGALVDTLAAIEMLSPRIFAVTNQLSGFSPPVEYRFAMHMGASLMFGWTLLLIWADQKPLERKGILILTIPVIVALIANEIWSVTANFISIKALLPVFILQIVLIVLFALSYWKSVDKGDTE